jgi:hypothetical protein
MVTTSNTYRPSLKRWTELTPEEQEKARRLRMEKLENAARKLSAGIEDLVASDRWKDYLAFQGRFHHYSFCNTLLIMLQRPNATQVASYNTWQSVNRFVMKAEGGISIFVPILVKGKASKEAQILEPEVHGYDEKELPGEEVDTEHLVGFKIGYVFDVSQTDGEPIPPDPVSLLQGDDEELYQALKAFAEDELKVEVQEAGKDVLPGSVNGDCQYRADGHPSIIRIKGSNPILMKAKTMTHELGHAILHGGTEYRQHSSRSLQELEAESLAFLVLHAFGVDSGEYSFGYLAGGGNGEEAVKAIQSSGERIRKAAH